MAGIVTLTVQDDESLYMTATALAAIADRLDAGIEIPGLANLLRAAGMTIASVMADAYDRAHEAQLNLN